MLKLIDLFTKFDSVMNEHIKEKDVWVKITTLLKERCVKSNYWYSAQ